MKPVQEMSDKLVNEYCLETASLALLTLGGEERVYHYLVEAVKGWEGGFLKAFSVGQACSSV